MHRCHTFPFALAGLFSLFLVVVVFLLLLIFGFVISAIYKALVRINTQHTVRQTTGVQVFQVRKCSSQDLPCSLLVKV